jgi:hypothetical protein
MKVGLRSGPAPLAGDGGVDQAHAARGQPLPELTGVVRVAAGGVHDQQARVVSLRHAVGPEQNGRDHFGLRQRQDYHLRILGHFTR